MALVPVRRLLKLELLAFGSPAVLYFAWLTTHFTPEKQTVGGLFALAFYALFLVADNPAILFASQILATTSLSAFWISIVSPYLAVPTAVSAVQLVDPAITKYILY